MRYIESPYSEIKKMEKRKMEHLKEVAKKSVENEFGFKVMRIEIAPQLGHDGDAIWMVDIWLENGEKKIKKGDTFYLEGAVGRAIWREKSDDAFARVPIILTHLPRSREAVA